MNSNQNSDIRHPKVLLNHVQKGFAGLPINSFRKRALSLALLPTAESPNKETSQDPNMVESSRRAHHGPKFLRLTAEQRQQLYRMHQNLGHPDSQILGNVLRDQGWESDAIEGIKDMHCPSCFENQKPKIARPGHLGTPRSFNDLVSIDAVKWTSAEGMSFTFYHMLDAGTNFQVAFLCVRADHPKKWHLKCKPTGSVGRVHPDS